MTIDKPLLRLLRTEIDAALKTIGDKHKLSIQTGNARFSSTNATFKLEVATIGDNGEVATKDAEDFKTYCNMFGLSPDHFGKTFVMKNVTYTVSGLKVSSPKFPVLGTRPDGKRFKFEADFVRNQLTKA